LQIERKLFPDNIRIIPKSPLPETVTQNHGRRCARPIFFREKVAPYQRLDAERREKLRRNESPRQSFRFTHARKIETLVLPHRYDGSKSGVLRAPIHKVGIGWREPRSSTLAALLHDYQSRWLLIRKRA
jgi:hypothetical protein